ncbi:MAG: endonuclease MutS2 [Treponemataceae bacterium]|nr:MAG: endonuclease MutS2 [Treponemataceae bacterium]
MDSKTLELLDFYRVRCHIAGLCASEDGKAGVSRLEPLTDAAEIGRVKSLGKDMLRWLKSAGTPPLGAWEPIDDALAAVGAEGSALAVTGAMALLRVTRVAGALQKSAQKFFSGESPLALLIAEIPPLAEPEALISRVIADNGELKDLPTLKAVKEEIARLKSGIESSLKRCIEGAKKDDALQSAVPVLRGTRQLVAVKAGARAKVRGIVHEVSQTGQTFFVEPDDVVQKHNELVEREFFLERETRRILRELADSLKPFCADFAAARDVLTQTDRALASARWALETDGVFAAAAGASDTAAIYDAHHPLLGKNAVPIDIAFAPDCRVIVITGPNTGGKTVAIKTFALFALLNQCGFPVPASSLSDERATRLPVFSAVFADIGDEQSIDNSLSTFSSHMVRIRDILSGADERSLVLLDELGSGTDPQEGSALGLAVLDELIKKKSLVLVTSHHGAFKNFAFTHAGCANASVEFDSTNLVPAYRVISGIPGKSAAIEIAHNSGIPPDVIERAKTYLAGGHTDMAALIQGLTEKYEEAERLSESLKVSQAEYEKKKQKLDAREIRLKENQIELAEQKLKLQKEFSAESRKSLENLVRILREGEITKEKTRAVKDFIARLEQEDAEAASRLVAEKAEFDAIRAEVSGAAQEDDTEEFAEENFAPGKSVRILSLKTDGVVVQKAAQKRAARADTAETSWVVQSGSVKLTVAESDMKILRGAAENPGGAEGITGDDVYVPESPQYELRLLGMRQEEAVKALERQLDLASASGFYSFCVIHGKGNGVLQQAVRDYLAAYPHVAEFHFALPEDGGTGKTYVEMKRN